MTTLFTEFLASGNDVKLTVTLLLVIVLAIQIGVSPRPTGRALVIHLLVFSLFAVGAILGVTKLAKSRDEQDAYMRALYQSCLDDGRPAYECRSIVYYPGGRR